MLTALGSSLLGKRISLSLHQFKLYFKMDPHLVQIVLSKVLKEFPCSAKHLLWTLYYLKTKNTNDNEIAAVLGVHRNTMRLHVIETLRKLLQVLPEVIHKIY
jgi:hypothetical protein